MKHFTAVTLCKKYPSHLYNLCHYALRLKNEDSMHNSCIKIFCALPAATVTSSNGVSISSSLKQLELGNCFAATNNIPSKTGCRHRLPPAALKHNCNIHGMAFTYCRVFNQDSAFLLTSKKCCVIWAFYLKSVFSADCFSFNSVQHEKQVCFPNPMFKAQWTSESTDVKAFYPMTHSLPHTHLSHVCTRKQVHSHLNPFIGVHILYPICIDMHRYIIFV